MLVMCDVDGSHIAARAMKSRESSPTPDGSFMRKLSIPREGPFQVIKHHNNGTVSYESEPFKEDRVNIRRISPYKWRNPPP